jgi:hypothetical protein
VIAASGWFAARPSGTEDIYKIYAESFRSEDHLRAILREAQGIVDAALPPQVDSHEGETGGGGCAKSADRWNPFAWRRGV